MQHIHVTDRQAFKRCRTFYDFKVDQRLEPIGSTSVWFHEGRAMHKGLEFYYRDGSNPVDVFLDAATKLPVDLGVDRTSELAEVLDRYVAYSKVEDETWEIVATELTLRKEVLPGVWLVGTIDLLVKWRGYLWIVDHKFMANFTAVETLELDDQMTAYMWLARENGYHVYGCIFNQVRKKLPTVPLLLKDKKGESKGLSKNVAIVTDYDTYLRSINAYGFDPADYEEFLNDLKTKEAKEHPFFRRDPVMRTRPELVNFGKYIEAELKDMTSGFSVYPSPSRDCLKCDFALLCKSRNEGGDIRDLIRTQYQVREDGER